MTASRHLIAFGLAFTLAIESQAATFHLLNRGLGLTNPQEYTVEGITLTLSGSATYNSTPTSFGMDSEFFMPDDPFLIDLTENLFFQFNQPVLLDSIVISQFDNEDSGGVLLKDLGVNFPLRNGTMNLGGVRVNKSASDRVYAAILTSGGTKGFSLDQIVVRAVPEPTTFLLVCLTGLSMFAVRRR